MALDLEELKGAERAWSERVWTVRTWTELASTERACTERACTERAAERVRDRAWGRASLWAAAAQAAGTSAVVLHVQLACPACVWTERAGAAPDACALVSVCACLSLMLWQLAHSCHESAVRVSRLALRAWALYVKRIKWRSRALRAAAGRKLSSPDPADPIRS